MLRYTYTASPLLLENIAGAPDITNKLHSFRTVKCTMLLHPVYAYSDKLMVVSTRDNTNSCIHIGPLAADSFCRSAVNARRQSNLTERNFVTDLVTECLVYLFALPDIKSHFRKYCDHSQASTLTLILRSTFRNFAS
jgi:hypothetical protein